MQEELLPVSREQFDKGLDDTRFRILNFLKPHPEQAFDVVEIAHRGSLGATSGHWTSYRPGLGMPSHRRLT
ncbi:hypothetical protein ACFLST_00040 [Chloroflexota bacterium]